MVYRRVKPLWQWRSEVKVESMHIRSGEPQAFLGKMTSRLRLEAWMGVRFSLLVGEGVFQAEGTAYAKGGSPRKESTFEKPRVGQPNRSCLNPSPGSSDESCPPGADWGHSMLSRLLAGCCSRRLNPSPLLTSSVSLGNSLNLKVLMSSSATEDSHVIYPTDVWEWQGTQ